MNIQRITRHTAELWFEKKNRDFYIVPMWADRQLSKGELVDQQTRDRYKTFDEFVYAYRGTIPYYKDQHRLVKFYTIN